MADKLSLPSEGYTQDFTRDENLLRGNWSGRFDFVLSVLGYAVGLGNVWRFPYLAYTNGGGLFLVPYFTMLFLIGIPMYVLEMSLGQFTSQSLLQCWECAPALKGIGWGMLYMNTIVSIYYNVIIAWAIYYFAKSITSELPWERCREEFAGKYCTDEYNELSDHVYEDPNEGRSFCSGGNKVDHESGECRLTVPPYTDGVTGKILNYRIIGIWDKALAEDNGFRLTTAAEDYLNNDVLGVNFGSFDKPGGLQWHLVLCLFIAWVAVALSLIRGVKSSGKVAYFTATFPYVIITALVIRGCTLEGGSEGLRFYLRPDYNKLGDFEVWKNAATQIFYSLGVCLGGPIVLSSYNRFHHNHLRDAFIVGFANCMTSFYAGFAVFSVIGFLSVQVNRPVDEVVASGVTLVFSAYPSAVARMPASSFWSTAFFFMVILLGIDSQFAQVEAIISCVLDTFPSLRKTKKIHAQTVAIVCFLGFISGLSMVTKGGQYMLNVLDYYVASWSLLLTAFLEVALIAYIYGGNRFANDISIMLGDMNILCWKWSAHRVFWVFMWKFITPVIVFGLFLFSLIYYEDIEIETNGAAYVVGWLVSGTTACVILACFIGEIVKYTYRLKRPVKEAFQPTVFWGPALPEHRYLMFAYMKKGEFHVNPWVSVVPAPVTLDDDDLPPDAPPAAGDAGDGAKADEAPPPPPTADENPTEN